MTSVYVGVMLTKKATMKHLLSILLISCAIVVKSQVSDDILMSLQEQHALLQSMERAAFVEQVGDGNQVNLNVSGNQVIAVLQQGGFNVFSTNITGDLNKSTIIQKGDLNRHELAIDGFGNKINILQEGNSNNIEQDLHNVSNLDIGLIQLGDGHEIIQHATGTSNTPITVTQQGSPMQIIITSGGN